MGTGAAGLGVCDLSAEGRQGLLDGKLPSTHYTSPGLGASSPVPGKSWPCLQAGRKGIRGKGGHPGERPWDGAEDGMVRRGRPCRAKGSGTWRDRNPVEVGGESWGPPAGRAVSRFQSPHSKAQQSPLSPDSGSPVVGRTDPGQDRTGGCPRVVPVPWGPGSSPNGPARRTVASLFPGGAMNLTFPPPLQPPTFYTDAQREPRGGWEGSTSLPRVGLQSPWEEF